MAKFGIREILGVHKLENDLKGAWLFIYNTYEKLMYELLWPHVKNLNVVTVL
jgi:hypothetical protein